MGEPVAIGALEDRFAQLMRLHHRVSRRYFRSVGLFNGHPAMLFHICRCPGITQKELSRFLEISPASVAVSIRRMEAAGLVSRQRDERDSRVIHLRLTPAGEAMDAACGRGRDFMMDTMYRGLTPQQRASLYEILEIMADNLQSACAVLAPADEEGSE